MNAWREDHPEVVVVASEGGGGLVVDLHAEGRPSGEPAGEGDGGGDGGVDFGVDGHVAAIDGEGDVGDFGGVGEGVGDFQEAIAELVEESGIGEGGLGGGGGEGGAGEEEKKEEGGGGFGFTENHCAEALGLEQDAGEEEDEGDAGCGEEALCGGRDEDGADGLGGGYGAIPGELHRAPLPLGNAGAGLDAGGGIVAEVADGECIDALCATEEAPGGVRLATLFGREFARDSFFFVSFSAGAGVVG